MHWQWLKTFPILKDIILHSKFHNYYKKIFSLFFRHYPPFVLLIFTSITCNVDTASCEDSTIKCEKKNKGTIECDKNTVTCDVGIAQCEDGTIKCEKKKKIKEPPNVTKVQSHVMLVLCNVRMVPSNVRKKKRRESPNVTKV